MALDALLIASDRFATRGRNNCAVFHCLLQRATSVSGFWVLGLPAHNRSQVGLLAMRLGSPSLVGLDLLDG
jgi:BarA-like signal transduction histidine kinase